MARRILLIDDDADTRTYLSTVLLRGGYKVETAADGEEGWEKIAAIKPDLILLDVMMPRKSGIRLLQQIKSEPDYKHIPVIVITGVGQMTGVDMRGFLTNGNDSGTPGPEGFMEKPIKPDRLLNAVREALGA